MTRRPLVLQLFNTREEDRAPADDGDGLEDGGRDDDDDDGEDDGAAEDAADRRGVTRRRNQKQRHQKKADPQHHEWGEFLHAPGKRFYDFGQIRDEIVRDTDRLAGPGGAKGVSPTPIHLKIYSPRVLSLTLVDLPGLTKVAVGGQPEDIAEQIHAITCRYGSNPNAILLAVTPATADLAGSDALKLARELDPRGERTVGVLTKLDLMDPGTDAAEVLHNRVIPLRRGYVAVVNRGQRDVDADLSIRVGLRNEERFFRTHPAYSRSPHLLAKCGTANLARSLNGILIHHIRECLPELKLRIANMMADVQAELEALGLPSADGEGPNSGGKLLGLLSKFSANFAAMIDGRASNTNQHHDGQPSLGHRAATLGMGDMHIGGAYGHRAGGAGAVGASADELYGGARISFIFHQVFGRSLDAVGAFDGLSEDEIRTTIGNANGTRPALFVPEISFDLLVRRQIRRLEQPGVQCVELVYDELQRIATQAEPSELTRYPNLRDRMMEVVSALLKRSVGPTQMYVSNLVRIELSYINTNHPDFIGGSRAVARLMEKIAVERETAARAPPAMNGGHQSQVGSATAGTPERERSNAPGNVGATPLSSSSLEKYMANDGQSSSSQHGAPPQHVVVDRTIGASTSNTADGGGIMNFIFRGNSASSVTAAPAVKHRGMGSSLLSAGSRLGGSGSAPGGGGGGPPAVVQLPQVPDAMRQTDVPPSDRERVETEIIKSLIGSYFSIVRKNYIDMVPKTIMYFLVNHVKDELQNELVSELYREAEVGHLMKEAEDIALRRKTCVEMRDLLKKALEIVNEVRDFNTFSK